MKKQNSPQTNIHRINGALVGLNAIKKEVKEQLKKHNYYVVSISWIEEMLDDYIKTYKDIKIKQLERMNEVKNKK